MDSNFQILIRIQADLYPNYPFNIPSKGVNNLFSIYELSSKAQTTAMNQAFTSVNHDKENM